MKTAKRIAAALLVLSMVLLLALPVSAHNVYTVRQLVNKTAAYLRQSVPSPTYGSTYGEWAVFGQARSGCAVPKGYYADYFDRIAEYLQQRQGVLNNSTDYARLILALNAIGQDARSVAGYDLTVPLGDFEKTNTQGVNGAIFALLALDCGDYPMPSSGTATRANYMNYIAFHALPGGGWSLYGSGEADMDITGMALQALAKYQDDERVLAATQKALALMSERQQPNGGYTTPESTAQILTALCELDIPLYDDRFVKNGNTLLDGLLTFRNTDGSFFHESGGDANQMSTEQAFYALVALKRAMERQPSLYRMSAEPPIDQETAILSANVSGTAAVITLSYSAVSPDYRLLAAVYAQNGQFLSAVSANATGKTLTLTLPPEADSAGSFVKCFLTAKQDGTPQCAAVTAS